MLSTEAVPACGGGEVHLPGHNQATAPISSWDAARHPVPPVPGGGLCHPAVLMPRSGRNYHDNTKCGRQVPRAWALPARRRRHRVPSHRPSPGTASLPARVIGRVPSGCSLRLRGDKGAGEVRAAGRQDRGGGGGGDWRGEQRSRKRREEPRKLIPASAAPCPVPARPSRPPDFRVGARGKPAAAGRKAGYPHPHPTQIPGRGSPLAPSPPASSFFFLCPADPAQPLPPRCFPLTRAPAAASPLSQIGRAHV